jgi:excinuclease ABC subunit B
LRGEVLEICPIDEDHIIRVEFFGDEVDSLRIIDPVSGEVLETPGKKVVYPAKHFITPEPKLQKALKNVDKELEEQIRYFKDRDKLLEAQRIEMRTRNDMEMLLELGFCNGVENYSRHLTGSKAGAPSVYADRLFSG